MRHFSDDEQYSEELLDKSTELWTGAVKKRQRAMQSLTPSYSKKYQGDNTNLSLTGVMDKQVESIKEKINSQKSASKHKDFQIQNLKAKINQLTKDKQILLNEIGSIQQDSQEHFRDNTINLEKTQQNQHDKSRHIKSHKSQLEESMQQICQQKLEDLPKEKILQLLRSTSQYRSFIDYHDSHDLVFLKELYDASKRTTKTEKRPNQEWSQAEILSEVMKFNEKENLGLSYHNQNNIIAKVKQYYDRQFELRAAKMKNQYEFKLKKAVKEASIVPQDLKQICKVKEGQLAHQMARKKVKSVKKRDHY